MKRSLLVLAFLLFLVAVPGPANAATITLDDLIGTAVPGSPADPSAELARLNELLSLYNSNSSGALIGGFTYVVDAGSNVPAPPLPAATGGLQVLQENLPFTLNTPSLYLLAKFGDQDAFYYLNGQLGSIDTSSIASPFPAQGGGLSHITLFSPTSVPEPAILTLLGLGLVGVTTFRRFMKR